MQKCQNSITADNLTEPNNNPAQTHSYRGSGALTRLNENDTLVIDNWAIFKESRQHARTSSTIFCFVGLDSIKDLEHR
jgi:hypothetical protein